MQPGSPWTTSPSAPWASTRLNESWVVGGTVVVKWMTDRSIGPHPAADRLRRLADAGFAESPTLVGLVEWREPDRCTGSPVAFVQAYLAGTEDGWTWVVAEARRALGIEPGEPHADFADDARPTWSAGCTWRWPTTRPERLSPDARAAQHADEALAALDLAVRLTRAARPRVPRAPGRGTVRRIEAILAGLGRRGGSPVLAGPRGPPRRPGAPRTPGGALCRRRLRREPDRARPSCGPRPRRRHATSPSMLVGAGERRPRRAASDAPDGRPDAAVDGLAWPDRRAQELFLAATVERLGERRDLFDEALRAGVRVGAALPRDRVRRPSTCRVALRPAAPRCVAAPDGRLMDPDLFLADLAEKPARLADLAAALRADDPWGASSVPPTGRGCSSAWAPRTTPPGRGSPPEIPRDAGGRRAGRLRPAARRSTPHDRRRDVRLRRVGRDPRRRTPAPSAGWRRPLRRDDERGRLSRRRPLRRHRPDVGRSGARGRRLPLVPAHARPAARPRGAGDRRAGRAVAAGPRGRGVGVPPRHPRRLAAGRLRRRCSAPTAPMSSRPHAGSARRCSRR